MYRDNQYQDELVVSLETLIGCSRLTGHHLENRRRIRLKAKKEFVSQIQQKSTHETEGTHLDGFALAPLDILVERTPQGNRFHVIELNGSGIGGFTNMSVPAIEEVLLEFEKMGRNIQEHDPLIIIGLSGKENDGDPRLNRLAHEKILYADAFRKGLKSKYKQVAVTTMASVLESGKTISRKQPIIIVGYLKEILSGLKCRDGQLYLRNRRVNMVVNDRLALNILSTFGDDLDVNSFSVVNKCFHAGGDKSEVYRLLNLFHELNQHKELFNTQIPYNVCDTAESLIETVKKRIAHGEKIVIKPFGTGLGHGIEFFLDANESHEAIEEKVYQSLDETQRYYGIKGGALPYTVCPFIDTAVIKDDSDFNNRKFEIRIVVYRSENKLKAFPLIAKISPVEFNKDDITKNMLINNITSSVVKTKKSGLEFMLPLGREETLKVLGIKMEEMESLSAECTRFVDFILRNQ